MGYSCATKASMTEEALRRLIGARCSNGMPDGGFYEVGREQPDGAITGSVHSPYKPDPSKCVRRGSFRIEPDGRVARFPGLPASMLRAAETLGAAAYLATHGTWQDHARALLATLDAGRVNPAGVWDQFQSAFQGWQREHRIAFAVLPAMTCPAMAQALRDMLAW